MENATAIFLLFSCLQKVGEALQWGPHIHTNPSQSTQNRLAEVGGGAVDRGAAGHHAGRAAGPLGLFHRCRLALNVWRLFPLPPAFGAILLLHEAPKRGYLIDG